MMMHKLRRAMIRPGRDRLSGGVEVDETYWGAEELGLIGRLTENKVLVAVAVEEDGRRIGRIRLQTIPDLKRATLHGFIAASVETGSTVRTDGFAAYLGWMVMSTSGKFKPNSQRRGTSCRAFTL